MIVRDETGGDVSAIRRVVGAAFGRAEEAGLVEALRKSDDSVISLVAEEAGEIVGHVLFSKLNAPDRCIALAPVSVMLNRQNQGIGSKLIRQGLVRAIRGGWKAVFLLGDPEFYGRFGFEAALADKFDTEYPKPYFLALELTGDALTKLSGPVIYAPPFLTLT